MNFVFEDFTNHLNLIESNLLRDKKEGNYTYNQSPLANDIHDLWNINRDVHQEVKPKTVKVVCRTSRDVPPPKCSISAPEIRFSRSRTLTAMQNKHFH